jgi:hypothetical protein
VSLDFLLADLAEAEQVARLRELRALRSVHVGLNHPVVAALGEAIGDLAGDGRRVRGAGEVVGAAPPPGARDLRRSARLSRL